MWQSLEQWKYSSCEDLLRGSNGTFEEHSILLGLVGGVEGLSHFLEHYNGADPMSTGESFVRNTTRSEMTGPAGNSSAVSRTGVGGRGSRRDKNGGKRQSACAKHLPGNHSLRSSATTAMSIRC
jgi:hypothetical protein